MRSSSLLAVAASLSTAAATAYQGFNYGATNSDGSFKNQARYEAEFKAAKNLVGTSGFTSARLYTMIQGGSSTNQPTEAIPAAIAQGTTLLLGIWASAGQGPFDAEITALKSAIQQYGSKFTDIVAGISVGSEDLYRNSPTGIAAKSGYGADPATLAKYIATVRSTIAGTGLAKAPIGHVDTWTAWVNGTNKAVIDAVDWVGVDAYPYFQDTQSNGVGSGKGLFEDAVTATKNAVGGKDVWITETGWPVSGEARNLAKADLASAKQYWNDVGCPRFGKTNIYWYTLQDADSTIPSPSFGILGKDLTAAPLFDLSCNASSSSTSASATASSTASGSATATGSGTAGATGAPSGGNATTTGTSAGATGVSGGSSNNLSTIAVPTTVNSNPTGSSAAPTSTLKANSASMITGSFAAVLGALFVVVAAL